MARSGRISSTHIWTVGGTVTAAQLMANVAIQCNYLYIIMFLFTIPALKYN